MNFATLAQFGYPTACLIAARIAYTVLRKHDDLPDDFDGRMMNGMLAILIGAIWPFFAIGWFITADMPRRRRVRPCERDRRIEELERELGIRDE